MQITYVSKSCNYTLFEDLIPCDVCRSHLTNWLTRCVVITSFRKVNLWFWRVLQRNNALIKFNQNPFSSSRVETWGQMDGQTHSNLHNFIVQRKHEAQGFIKFFKIPSDLLWTGTRRHAHFRTQRPIVVKAHTILFVSRDYSTASL